MDIEAEMRKLQAEARAQLEAEAKAHELPPTPIAPEKRAAAVPEPEEKAPSVKDTAQDTAALLNSAAGAMAAAKTASELASKVDPKVLQEAAELAEKGKKMSLKAKLIWGVVGLAGFLVAWHFVLAPLVAALIAISILILLVVAILKLTGFLDKDEEDEEDGDATKTKA